MAFETCYGEIPNKTFDKLSKIKLVVFDVDGTLTDSGVYYDNNGNELKKFSTKDGMGVANFNRCGLISAVITGRKSSIVEKRMSELGCKYIVQGVSDKIKVLSEILENEELDFSNVGYIGDDINDAKAMDEVLFSCCPKDAHISILNRVHYISQYNGGFGACREFCDLILMAQKKLSLDGSCLL